MAAAMLAQQPALLHAQAAPSSAPCPGWTYVEGQGPSCPTPGGWDVILGDGSREPTHGPDRLPASAASDPTAPALVGAARAPVCVANPATDPHMRVLYARAADVADRYAQMAPQIRDLVAQANGALNNEAQLSGVAADYLVRCLAGSVEVVNVVLPTPRAQADFSTIVSDLRNQGFNSNLAKYWVWYDATMGSIGGQGHLYNDDRAVASNANNNGNVFAVTYGVLSARIMMHENGHNLGAVQNSAPHTTNAGHCNDGIDVMCYADGGSSANYNGGICTDYEHFDCNHDDYFHPSPPPGSYLATHWNLASDLNRFVRFVRPGAPTAPSAPRSLVAAPGASPGQIALSWQAPSSDGGAAVTAYKIYRGTSSGGATFLAQIGNTLSYTDSGLPAGATRFYQVSAVNNAGEGPRSSEASGTAAGTPVAAPAAPAGLSASSGAAGQVELSWLAPTSDGGSAVTGYKVYRGTSSGSETFLAQVGNVTAFTDAGLPEGAVRYYQVSALNSAGESPRTSEASAAAGTTAPTPPGAPRSLAAVPGNAVGEVRLTWLAPASDGGAPVAAYRLYRGTASGNEQVVANLGTATTYTDTGQPPGTVRYYQVAAVNSVGEGPRGAEASAAATDVPTAPPNLTAAAGPSAGQIRLAWSAPADGGRPIVTYRIYRGNVSGGETLAGTAGVALSYIDSGLPSGAVRYYRVSAVTSAGEGPLSVEASAAARAGGPPGAPRNVAANPTPQLRFSGTDTGATLLRVSWTAPADNGGSSVQHYRIYRGFSRGSETFLAEVDGTVAAYNDGTASTAQAQYYAISAVNAFGEGARSASACGAAAPWFPPLQAPGGGCS